MKIAVVGTGHVGLVTAACLAHIGHDVIGVDENTARIRAIAAGDVPFFEPGLQELVADGIAGGRLRFADGITDAVREAAVVFVCVGTPSKPDGAADLGQV